MNDVLVSRLSRRAPMIERLAFRPDMIIGLSHRLCLFRLLSSGGDNWKIKCLDLERKH